MVHIILGKEQDPNNRAKRARGVTQAIECLYSKHKALTAKHRTVTYLFL
jgi:hypothetical protein